MKKTGLFLLITVILFFSVAHTAFAEEGETVPPEYSSLIDGLDDDITQHLPEGMLSNDAERVGEAVAQMSGADYLLAFVAELTGAHLASSVSLLTLLLGIILISAVFSAFKSSFASAAISRAISFCSSCAIFAVIISLQIKDLRAVGDFFERTSGFMLGVIPLTSVVYAMGGNVLTAAKSSGTLYLFLAFCESFCAATVMPVASTLTALSLCGALSPGIKLTSLSLALKRCYTVVLGFIMSILLFVLSAETALAASADGIPARAAKLMATSIIPIVGGSIGETLRTVGASVGYMKSVLGIGGVILLLLMILPTLISLLLTRLVFILSSSVAEMLGCEAEGKVLSEAGGVYATLIAVVAMVGVMFIFALTVFVRCAVASA